jgi:hypothetical protein
MSRAGGFSGRRRAGQLRAFDIDQGRVAAGRICLCRMKRLAWHQVPLRFGEDAKAGLML